MAAFINKLIQKIEHCDISAHAASAAFFMFLSIFPILMLLCSVLPYTHISEADLMRVVTDLLPSTLDALAINIISELYEKSVALISISAVFIVWLAAKGIMALIRGLNSVQEVDETRNYFLVRFWASVYTVVLLVLIVFTLIVVVFGNQIVAGLFARLPKVRNQAIIFMPFRYLVVLIALSFVFALMYARIPNKKSSFMEKLPGAIFASIGWSGFSWAFSIYVERFGALNMYGSLMSIVIVMLWLYFCMYLLLLGDVVNYYLNPLIVKIKAKRRNAAEKKKEAKKAAQAQKSRT